LLKTPNLGSEVADEIQGSAGHGAGCRSHEIAEFGPAVQDWIDHGKVHPYFSWVGFPENRGQSQSIFSGEIDGKDKRHRHGREN